MKEVALEKLLPPKVPNLDPQKFPDECFELWSIPSFDTGMPEIVIGKDIGSSKKCVEPGDVLLSRIVPHIRRAWIVKENEHGARQIASGEWIVFRGKNFYPEYLRHVLVSDPFHAKFMQTVAGVGGSLVRARPENVKKIKVPLPSIDEQKRIAVILDQADSLRRSRRQSIEKLNSLSQAIFYEMFGEWGIRTNKWPIISLGERLDFLTSGSRGWAQYYSDSGDKFIRIQNVQRDFFLNTDLAYVNAPDTAESKRIKVRPRDVLLSITADLGRAAVVPSDIGTAYINQHLAILRTSNFNPVFLASALTSASGQANIIKRNREAVKAGLNFDDIRSIEVIEPPRQLQNEYEKRINEKTKILTKFKLHLEELENLFLSLQQRAFRGEL